MISELSFDLHKSLGPIKKPHAHEGKIIENNCLLIPENPLLLFMLGDFKSIVENIEVIIIEGKMLGINFPKQKSIVLIIFSVIALLFKINVIKIDASKRKTAAFFIFKVIIFTSFS